MSDLILNKQRKQAKQDIVSRPLNLTKVHLRIAKYLLLALVYLAFVTMSLMNKNLFLSELLVTGGILAILLVVHLLSNRQ